MDYTAFFERNYTQNKLHDLEQSDKNLKAIKILKSSNHTLKCGMSE